MVARRELFPTPLSWQTQVSSRGAEIEKAEKHAPTTWREQLGSPHTKVLVALGIGMVLGWIIKRNR